VACGQRAPQRDLVRFVAVAHDGAVRLVCDPAYRSPGRGAYVCAGTACFEVARSRRAFQRALRIRGGELLIDEGLIQSLAA
jgi:predicted RNA-binding protein YlxR (DUF448 family)